MNFLKRMFCNHDFKFVRNIYGDEIIECGWKRSVWICQKCGKTALREEFVPPSLRVKDNHESHP
jgi:hypothetical protein